MYLDIYLDMNIYLKSILYVYLYKILSYFIIKNIKVYLIIIL